MRKIGLHFLFSVGFYCSAYCSDQLDSLLSDSKNLIGRENWEEAWKVTELANREAKERNSDYHIIYTYYNLGRIATHNKDFGKAVIYYLEGARFGEFSNDANTRERLINTYINLAIIMGDYGHFDLAYRFIDNGLKIAIELKKSDKVIQLMHNKVHELLNDEKYDEAISISNDLLNNYNLDEVTTVWMRNKIGLAYLYKEDYNRAQEEFHKNAVDIVESISPQFYSHALYNIGYSYFNQGAYLKAAEFCSQAIDINKKYELFHSYFQSTELMGLIYDSLHNPYLALEYYYLAESLIDKEGVEPETYGIYEKIGTLYESIGDRDKALEYGRLYTEKLKEFIDKQKEIEELDRKYNMQLLTDRYFDLLEAQEEKRATVRTAQLSVGGVIFLSLVAIFFIYFRQYRTRLAIERELRYIEEHSEV